MRVEHDSSKYLRDDRYLAMYLNQLYRLEQPFPSNLCFMLRNSMMGKQSTCFYIAMKNVSTNMAA